MTRKAVVFGAGGIGAALVHALAASGAYDAIHAGQRDPCADWPAAVVPFAFDLAQEDTIARAAQAIGGPVDLVIVASGVLSDPARDIAPEKSFQAIDAGAMAHVLAINTIGPALIAKHMLPLLPRDRPSVFAALSARVGSLGDNRLGGWHSYRASKVALNMLLANFAIEMARSHPQAVIVGLHPGTVATRLSEPFRGSVRAGQLFAPERAAEQLLGVIERLGPQDSGGVFAWDGQRLAW
ncbi:MAG TPA: SDR family NAD(P)-dependent oxidoreductase [Novosphingobium sp.]|nr:SDR family NAD(P)-dependent oxidoreductase [Novosphingobium sp.]